MALKIGRELVLSGTTLMGGRLVISVKTVLSYQITRRRGEVSYIVRTLSGAGD